MRLLERKADGDFRLVELKSEDMQPYAILSHAWERQADQEVTFRDIIDGTGKEKVGYGKIEFCGKQAADDGIQYFWVDTCSIDKSSSAELSEAINSMYHCKWFTRGWTLQELIAPPEVVFYSKEWTYIGARSELVVELTAITGIDRRVLRGAHPSICSIADRMFWAAKRTTTREEDIAYSLLGIFDINMPLLYGERGKAFLRLQEEIIKVSDDQSVFAWESSGLAFSAGLLATSPKDFVASGGIQQGALWSGSEPSSMTSKGLRATFRLEPNPNEGGTYYALLACYHTNNYHDYAIVLQHIQGDHYIRINSSKLERLPRNLRWVTSSRKTVHVKESSFQPLQQSRFLRYATAEKDLEWFWITGTKDVHFSEPTHSAAWYPEIALYKLRLQKFGRLLIDHDSPPVGIMSLHFGVRQGKPFCALAHHASTALDEPRGGKLDEILMRKTGQDQGPYIFMTARISQIVIHWRPCTVIALCVKTVQGS
ncbi:hypothetical protein FB567DRAFT_618970 [Paraphoma chrysanthemicola]|uniref:DUF8212 domain-containing protein n=1 Tax=Paraphoma chrysanthemicola TaxID=798071 RepID=A0A8K0RC08_9PLEO|nr:hypothetical protein FB567DRAFT_618970 [Paraphoma chrysanthemicola]